MGRKKKYPDNYGQTYVHWAKFAHDAKKIGINKTRAKKRILALAKRYEKRGYRQTAEAMKDVAKSRRLWK